MSRIAYVCSALSLVALLPDLARAADHPVPADVAVVDASYDGGVAPGDRLVLAAGRRGPLRLEGLAGSMAAPIAIISAAAEGSATTIDPCPTACSGAGGGVGLDVVDSSFLFIDGKEPTTTPAIQFASTADGVTAYLRISGETDFIAVVGTQIDGSGSSSGDGILVRDTDTDTTIQRVSLFDNRIANVGGAGVAIGFDDPTLSGATLRDIGVSFSFIQDTGGPCVIALTVPEGTMNQIHENLMQNCGEQGIVVGSFAGSVYINGIENAGGTGIQRMSLAGHGDLDVSTDIHTNVVVGGVTGIDLQFDGVARFNTVVSPSGDGITSGSGMGRIYGNLVAGAAGTPIAASAGYPEQDNWSGSVAEALFNDPDRRDYSLMTPAPCVDAVAATPVPPEDFDFNPKPSGARSDCGAYEHEGPGGPPRDAGPGGGEDGGGMTGDDGGVGPGDDGGAGGVDAGPGGGGDGGGTGRRDAGDGSGGDGDGGGCGCRTTGDERSSGLFLLVVVGWVLFRRRR